jgi:hypothetical protein
MNAPQKPRPWKYRPPPKPKIKPAFDKAWQDKMREISGTKEPRRKPK